MDVHVSQTQTQTSEPRPRQCRNGASCRWQARGGVSLAIKWVKIIFHKLNNLNEVVIRIEEVKTKINIDNVGPNEIVEGVRL